MTFGRHKGEEVEDIPDDYLAWLHENADIRSAALRGEVEREYARRFEPDPEPPKRAYYGPIKPALVPIARKIVDAGYRALTLKNHPDVGGDPRAMVAINAAAEELRRLTGGC